MDDFDRDSNASSDNDRDHDDDMTMHDVDGDEENDNADQDHDDDDENDGDNDNDGEDNNENDDDDDDDQEQQPDGDESQQQQHQPKHSATPGDSTSSKWRPVVRPEVFTAKTYDIVPTMAAPMATSVNAIAITPDLRYWMTGGTDGYIRKYDGPSTINGKTLLTVAQRHPFVDSVTKAGVLMSYWENSEPQSPNARQEDLVLSPVYSLAVESQALWLLSGLESGGINLQSVRHDEGKKIACLQRHTNAVSALTLAADEKSVLSGSWDKSIFDWDLNTGNVIRQFDGSGGQISAIEIRPMGGAPVPPEASEEELPSDTLFSSNGFAAKDGLDFKLEATFQNLNGIQTNGTMVNGSGQMGEGANDMTDAPGSPSHDSLFGGSPGGGSDLFGDNDGMAFGGDDDNEFSRAMMQDSAQDSLPMGDYNTNFDDSAPAPSLPAPADLEQPSTETLPDSSTTMSAAPMASGDEFASLPAPSEMDTQPMTDGPPLPAVQLGTMGGDPVMMQNGEPHQSPSALFAAPAETHHDTTQTSDSTFLSASMDGTIRVWDRRVQNPIARIGNRPGVPPWCMGACWSPDGNWIYAGRRNGTVEEFSVQKARGGRVGWQPERVFKFPGGSGPVSCVRPMANGRHLICASHDILRLYDLKADLSSSKHTPPPFLIIPGPPRAGVISSLYIDASSRFMLSAAGNRGWEGSSTEVLIGYEINVP